MKLLQELVNPNSVTLTDTAQGVLVAIASSPTPAVAFQTTNGADKSVSARNLLRSLGLIVVNGNQAALTRAGEQMALNYNLVDETGQPTERGEAVLSNFNGRYNSSGEEPTQQNPQPAPQSAQPPQSNPGEDQQ